ncbi:MAG: hypothetical protein V1678_04580 [Candidatus Aenigmatarchaeota archaeon]
MKGIFYSIMIALFLIPLLGLIVFFSETQVPQNIDTNIRSNEMQYFSESIETDLERFLQINARRAVIASVSMVIKNGVGLDNSELRLAEVINNGTLYNTTNNTFSDQKNITEWENSIRVIAASSGFDINFTKPYASITVTQNDSFSLLFNATLYDVNISDDSSDMGIYKNISIMAVVSIEGMEDPLYSNKTYTNVFVPIIRSPFTTPLSISELALDISSSYYHPSTRGPSFLNRLEGKTELTGAHGLESFINLPTLTGTSQCTPQSSTLSDIDYEYWPASAQGRLLNASSQGYSCIFNWFRISDSAAADYGISGWLS